MIEGGNIEFQNALCRCRDCGDEQINAYNQIIAECPECGSINIDNMTENYIKNEDEIDKKKTKTSSK